MRGVTTRILVVAAALTILGGASARPTPWGACGYVCGDYLPSWSPDGRTIAFVHYVHGRGGPRATIGSIRASGGPMRSLVGLQGLAPNTPSGPEGPFIGLTWSPDSSQLAIDDPGISWVIPATGGRAHAVLGFDLAWSPDSRQVAYDTQLDIGSFRNVQLVPSAVDVAAADGTGARTIAGTDATVLGGRWATDPVWSTGNEIAYLTGMRLPNSKQPDPATEEIWVVRPDGAGARRLVGAGNGVLRLLGWSADGRRLFFVAPTLYGATVDVVDETGGTPTQIYGYGFADTCCRVSPDGSHLLVMTQNLEHEGLFDLQAVNLPTGSATVLLHSVPWETAKDASWSPTGDRITFGLGGECGPLSGIQTMPAAGGRATRLTSRCRRDGTAGANVMRGAIGPDALYGHGGNDVIFGGGGSDFLQGGAGDDRIHGGPGNDRLYGGPGVDMLFGNDGNDTVWSRDRSADVVHCGTGKDTVYADRLDVVSPDCEVLYRH